MRNWDNESAQFDELKGKTIKEITGLEKESEKVVFEMEDGTKYNMQYYHDCCASCSVEDVCGDVKDLVGSPILLAEEVSSNEPDETVKAARAQRKREYEEKHGSDAYYYGGHESETWTFYKLSTIKGSVTIRWYGESNGYYSESATFERIVVK